MLFGIWTQVGSTWRNLLGVAHNGATSWRIPLNHMRRRCGLCCQITLTMVKVIWQHRPHRRRIWMVQWYSSAIVAPLCATPSTFLQVEPTRVQIPNSISIGSAVFLGVLISVTSFLPFVCTKLTKLTCLSWSLDFRYCNIKHTRLLSCLLVLNVFFHKSVHPCCGKLAKGWVEVDHHG